MKRSITEFFGEPIFVYTEEDGLNDGILMKNPSEIFEECDLITANLWSYIEKLVLQTSLTEPKELLDIVMKQAKRIYDKERFAGDNDKNFFVIKGRQIKPIWFARNGNNKLTAMRLEDY